MAHVETLPLLLKQLALPAMLMHWQEQEMLSQERQDRPARFLANLAELEANRRYARRIAAYAKEARLPPAKTLATFDFASAPCVNYQQILALCENTSWVKQASNVLFFGPSGVGKTHLAAAIAYRMIEQGIRCLFTSTTDIVQKMQAAKQQFKLPDMLARLARYPLIILDDIGYAKKDETETSVLFELIAQRYENHSLIITANQPFSEWHTIFPDNMMAVAAVDRLIHHATVITLTPLGKKSFRQIASEKNNLHLHQELKSKP